jgi:hypothetical protein
VATSIQISPSAIIMEAIFTPIFVFSNRRTDVSPPRAKERGIIVRLTM